MPFFAGIDWASAEHALCVVDKAGKVRERSKITHTAKGLAELLRTLKPFGKPESLPIAIERPSGLLVDLLLEAGYAVVAIHPNAVKAARPRYGAALAKTDAGDAYMLADLLRTDGHRFDRLRQPSDDTKALRALVRTRDDLVGARVALANQLRSLLESFWPGANALFAEIDSPIALAFCDTYPTPERAEKLDAKRMARFLVQHSYSGRRSVAELLERLRSAPKGLAEERESEAKGIAVRALAKVLDALVKQIGELNGAIDGALAQHPDGQVIASFPRSGRINAAQILAELGDDRRRFATDDQLAAEAGVAPVTRASGKSHAVVFRFACNKRLRSAITMLADNSRRACAWAADVYRRARERACDHPHAIRILARAWIRVIWRCWQNGTPYDPAQHSAAKRLALIPASGG
jgi:transposase